ncbi:hypothetical protein VNI00_018317 [Paramarasmius palmivorus]|uniref:Uncharacterized protein n=1 Tax=Paramarasmius palmivorus TaxID=297713 RepID=A0AAW0AZH6_9AGAR
MSKNGWVARISQLKQIVQDPKLTATPGSIELESALERLKSIAEEVASCKASRDVQKVQENVGFGAIAMVLWFDLADQITASEIQETNSEIFSRNGVQIPTSMANLKTGLYILATVSPILALGTSSLFKRPQSNVRIIQWAACFAPQQKSSRLHQVERAIMRCIWSVARREMGVCLATEDLIVAVEVEVGEEMMDRFLFQKIYDHGGANGRPEKRRLESLERLPTAPPSPPFSPPFSPSPLPDQRVPEQVLPTTRTRTGLLLGLNFAGMATGEKRKNKRPKTVDLRATPAGTPATPSVHEPAMWVRTEGSTLMCKDPRDGAAITYQPFPYESHGQEMETIWRGDFVVRGDDNNSLVHILTYVEYCQMPEATFDSKKAVVILDRIVEGRDRVDRGGLSSIGDVNKERIFRDAGLEGGRAAGTLLDILQHLNQEGKILECGDITGNHDAWIPKQFGSDRISWHAMRENEQYPTDSMSSSQVSTADWVQRASIVPDGLAVVLSVVVGTQVVAIATSENDPRFSKATSFVGMGNMDENWRWKLVYLKRGDGVIIAPNTPYVVIATKDCIWDSSRLLSAKAIEESRMAIYNSAVANTHVTNGTYPQSRQIFASLFGLWLKYITDRSTTAVYYNLQYAIMDGREEDQGRLMDEIGVSGHLPMLGTLNGVLQLLAAANLVGLWSVLVPEGYGRTAHLRELDTTTLSPSREAIASIFKSFAAHLLLTSSSGDEVTLEEVHRSWLLRDARVLLEARRRYKIVGIAGITPELTVKTLTAKLDVVLSRYSAEWAIVKDSDVGEMSYEFDDVWGGLRISRRVG